MLQLKILSCFICLYGIIGAHGADKYTDENRPYEFGFTIEGEQHRHEKKDENGIIMGEFGFITADGVYHVTVYATDEQGRFKILSMKNIRVKPYPTAGGGVKKGHSIPFPPSENAPVVQGPAKTSSPQQQSKPVQINKQISSPAKSCSHCSLPTTTTKAPPQLTDIAVVSKDRQIPGSSGLIASDVYRKNNPLSSSTGQNNFSQKEAPSYSGQQNIPTNQNFGQNNKKYPEVDSQNYSFDSVQQNNQQRDFSGNQNSPPNVNNLNYARQNNNENAKIPTNIPQNIFNANQNNPQVGNDGIQSNPPIRNSDNQYYHPEENSYLSQNNPQKKIDSDQYHPQQEPITNSNHAPSGPSFVQPHPRQEIANNLQAPKETSRNPKQYNEIPTSIIGTGQSPGFGAALASQSNQPVSNRPTLLAAQMQIVPKDTDIYHRNPGEEEGLPSGISKDDMTHLLYTFNYTVGFHGHHEEGYSNGAKKGYYFVTGRNGVRTRVDYEADEKGFRPRISQEVLDLLSDDVPKPETEKDEKFGLKGYEFKWLYFPTN